MYNKLNIEYLLITRGKRSENCVANEKRPKKNKPETKQVHFECEVALYKDFEKYCYGNGKSVSEALRAYIKMCLGK